MKNINKYIRSNIASLCPYSTARDEYKGSLGIFLDANENPYENGWNRYPDPRQRAVKARISAIKNIPEENIFFGNGSDEAIDLIFRIFCRPGIDNAIAIAPSYGMYAVSASINDIEVRQIQLNEDFSLPVEKLLDAADANSRVMFLCSPNNPTGNAFPEAQLMELVDKFDGMVVIDEAYADFSAKGSLIRKVLDNNNLIILQTLSKAWGMAALRFGMAFSCKQVIDLMLRVKYPYNINKPAQELALKLLDQPVGAMVEEIKEQRIRVAAELARLPFIRKVYPSDANFILIKVDQADALYEHLIKDEIIVRNRNRIKGCEGCLRVTIGTKEENDRLLESISRYKA